ncbi:MAG: hypothetical protein ACOYXT_21285 [Bacteroidota bacterium]
MDRIKFFFALLFLGIFFIPTYSIAQTDMSVTKLVDLDLAAGDSEGSLTLALNYDRGLGKQHKIVIGAGARFTSYLGKNQYYVTAPARLTSGSTGPGVLFKENIEANMDSFLIQSAQVNSLNLLVTIGYNVSEKLMLRFNIDVVGFSFGKGITGNYINGSQGAMEQGSPTSFNLLLISDNDKGTLNSELFARYLLNDKWGLKAGLQFLFTEYTTDSEVQQIPEANDRFRNKSLMFSAGVSYKL